MWADLNADSSGTHAGVQSGYTALLANTVMKTKGQAIGLFCYSKALGVGNSLCAKGVVDGWDGRLKYTRVYHSPTRVLSQPNPPVQGRSIVTYCQGKAAANMKTCMSYT